LRRQQQQQQQYRQQRTSVAAPSVRRGPQRVARPHLDVSLSRTEPHHTFAEKQQRRQDWRNQGTAATAQRSRVTHTRSMFDDRVDRSYTDRSDVFRSVDDHAYADRRQAIERRAGASYRRQDNLYNAASSMLTVPLNAADATSRPMRRRNEPTLRDTSVPTSRSVMKTDLGSNQTGGAKATGGTLLTDSVDLESDLEQPQQREQPTQEADRQQARQGTDHECGERAQNNRRSESGRRLEAEPKQEREQDVRDQGREQEVRDQGREPERQSERQQLNQTRSNMAPIEIVSSERQLVGGVLQNAATLRAKTTSWRRGTSTNFGGHSIVLRFASQDCLFLNVPLFLYFSAQPIDASTGRALPDAATVTGILRYNVHLERVLDDVNDAAGAAPTLRAAGQSFVAVNETPHRALQWWREYEESVYEHSLFDDSLAANSRPPCGDKVDSACDSSGGSSDDEEDDCAAYDVESVINELLALECDLSTSTKSTAWPLHIEPTPPTPLEDFCEFTRRYRDQYGLRCACQRCAQRIAAAYNVERQQYEKALADYRRRHARYLRHREALRDDAERLVARRLAERVERRRRRRREQERRRRQRRRCERDRNALRVVRRRRRERFCRRVPEWRATLHFDAADAPAFAVSDAAREDSYLARRVTDTQTQTAVLRTADLNMQVFCNPMQPVTRGEWCDWYALADDAQGAGPPALPCMPETDEYAVAALLSLANHTSRYEITWQLQVGSVAAAINNASTSIDTNGLCERA